MPLHTAFTGSVPDNYDKYLGPVLFEPYAVDLTDRLKGATLQNVLEIACGTGRVTAHLADAIPSNGQLMATDLNEDMLEIAKEKTGNHNVHFQIADAQELPFDDNTFDHVVCQFGVMFFPDKLKAFREVYRVLQPGGKFLFNTWDSYESNPRSHLVKQVLNDVFKEKSPGFVNEVPHSFYSQDEIKQLLQQAGFNAVKLETVSKTSYYANVDYLIYGFFDGTPISVFLMHQPAELREAAKQQLKERILEQCGDHHIEVPMQALVCEATKA